MRSVVTIKKNNISNTLKKIAHCWYSLSMIKIAGIHYLIFLRWGRVRSVVTLREVASGEELLVDYGYDLIRWHHHDDDDDDEDNDDDVGDDGDDDVNGNFRCPAWFRQLWNQQLGHKYTKHCLPYFV